MFKFVFNFVRREKQIKMIITTKDINGEDIKMLVDDSVGRFIKMNAIIEQEIGGQKLYKINNVIYTFDDEL